jgi:tripartite-type tricarboxylate transporter receptor subunit TctC
MPPIIPHIRRGKALAVTKDKRAAVLPDVPTIAKPSRLR